MTMEMTTTTMTTMEMMTMEMMTMEMMTREMMTMETIPVCMSAACRNALNRMREELRRLRGDREGGSRQVQERVRGFERELADIESALDRVRGQRGPRGRERGPGGRFAPERMRPDRPTRPLPPFGPGRRAAPRPGSERGPEPPHMEAQRRIRHLEVAAENLEQAGLHEQADRVRREAEEMRRALAEEVTASQGDRGRGRISRRRP